MDRLSTVTDDGNSSAIGISAEMDGFSLSNFQMNWLTIFFYYLYSVDHVNHSCTT